MSEETEPTIPKTLVEWQEKAKEMYQRGEHEGIYFMLNLFLDKAIKQQKAKAERDEKAN